MASQQFARYIPINIQNKLIGILDCGYTYNEDFFFILGIRGAPPIS